MLDVGPVEPPPNIPWLGLADPVAALTHLLAAPAAVWAIAHLWGRTHGAPARRVSVLIFGVSSLVLFLASGCYHAAFEPWKAHLRRLDHAAIYVLIAGTFTPLVAHMTDGWLRSAILAGAWAMAVVGVTNKLFFFGLLPEALDIGLYLAMGWFGLVPGLVIARARRWGVVRWMLLGGACYTVGAVCELLRWPSLIPGVLGGHEVFHVAVLAGSAAFLALIVRHVTPRRPADARPA